MTESEWASCTTLETMREALHENGLLADRKVRLFDCACVRRIWDMLTDERSRAAVEVAERFADGHGTVEELGDAESTAHGVLSESRDAWADASRGEMTSAALHATWLTCWRDAPFAEHPGPRAAGAVAVAVANRRRSGEGALTAEERVALAQARAGRDIDVYLADEEAEQCRLLRDLFHSPSVKPVIDPEWLTPTVVLLARGIHDERTFDRLPYLADALQDGGCDDERVLEHCRGPGPHVRGCWAVDLVLGKT